MMMGAPSAALGKAERDAWIQAKIAKNRKLKENEEARLAEEALQAKERLWSPYGRAALVHNELNIAWKGDLDIFHWTRVLPYRDLVALRVTGHALVDVPAELPIRLPNHLTGLPDTLCTLPALTSLSASNNNLTCLPESFGSLVKLRWLRLDWNRIKELPYSFRHLTALESIHMERNPMTMPPLEIIYQGASTAVAYMHQRYLAWLRQERRKVVEQLQAVLAAFQVELDVAMSGRPTSDVESWAAFLAVFTPGVERIVRGTALPFYALVLPALFSVSATNGMATMVLFKAYFRRCGCIDPTTNARKPCNRTPAPYQCERHDAALFRVKMVTAQEYKEMQSDSYLVARRERLANAMRAKCKIEALDGNPRTSTKSSQHSTTSLHDETNDDNASHDEDDNSKNSDDRASDDEDDAESASDRSDSDETSEELADDPADANSWMAGLGDIPGLEPVTNWIDAATAIIEVHLRVDGHLTDVAVRLQGILDTRQPPKKPHLEEVAHMYNHHLRDTYTKHKMAKVRNKVVCIRRMSSGRLHHVVGIEQVTTEFYQMRFVLRKWMGFGNRVVFVAWRDYVRETVAVRKATSTKQRLDDDLAQQNRIAEVELGKLDALCWAKKVNPYTDAEYYEHRTTVRRSFAQPHGNCIPTARLS
ncbi:hypothetical protein DYB32_000394 [Aphanomyces invadans]|uniref:Uncharacterized protein n=1 Tax=Aphanomyces invadans TaxID=157072 RepID=A0A418BA97_9STRA|nr:hypothetical protein DYB32_000394 [Aphanomyces invadans]